MSMTTKTDNQRTTPGDRERERLLAQERLILEVTEVISRLLDAQGVSRKALAEALGTSQAFVTKLLRGDNNFTLRTLSDVLFRLDRSAHLETGPLAEGIRLPAEFTNSWRISDVWTIPSGCHTATTHRELLNSAKPCKPPCEEHSSPVDYPLAA